uniref:Uncharacterized protein n=1 Tax=Arundo donax TaxID=35708 RepID=A0A0A9F0B8_ARUDO
MTQNLITNQFDGTLDQKLMAATTNLVAPPRTHSHLQNEISYSKTPLPPTTDDPPCRCPFLPMTPSAAKSPPAPDNRKGKG